MRPVHGTRRHAPSSAGTLLSARTGILPALLLLPALAGAQPELELRPAWDGRFLAGADTELGIRVYSEAGGPFRLELESPGFRLTHRGRVEPERPLDVWLPVHPGPEGLIRAQAELPGGSTLTREVRFLPLSAPFPVRVGATAGDQPVSALPRNAAGYGPVSILYLPAAAIGGLDPRQARALELYLGHCGTLELQGAGPGLLESARRFAGCGGSNLHPSDATRALPEPGPSGAEVPPDLRRLLDSDPGPGPAAWLAGFFLAYFALLWGSWRATRRPAAVLLLAPLAGAALAAAGAATPVLTRAIALLELNGGPGPGRLAVLLDATGTAGGSTGIGLRDLPALPRSLDAEPLVARTDGDHPRDLVLDLSPPPLARRAYAWTGVNTPVSRPVLRIEGDSARLENRGDSALAAGLLAFAGRAFHTPPLPPGAHWSTHGDTPSPERDARLDLLRGRAGPQGALWLLPMAVADRNALPGHPPDRGWLLVHPAPEDSR